jgi:DNA-directed RNA polymerase subunit K/omega
MIGPLARSLASDRFCMTVGITVDLPHEQTDANARPAPPITNRFLFVNVAATRAKQLHRGAKPRLDASHAAILELGKAERIAIEEVRCGLVQYTPESSLAA